MGKFTKYLLPLSTTYMYIYSKVYNHLLISVLLNFCSYILFVRKNTLRILIPKFSLQGTVYLNSLTDDKKKLPNNVKFIYNKKVNYIQWILLNRYFMIICNALNLYTFNYLNRNIHKLVVRWCFIYSIQLPYSGVWIRIIFNMRRSFFNWWNLLLRDLVSYQK